MEALISSCSGTSAGTAQQIFTLLFHTLLAGQCSISHSDEWPQDHYSTVMERGLEDFDFIIVGAGSAGSVIANRLSENAKWNILLLEAGGNPPMESEIPVLFFNIQNTTYDWSYYAEPSTTGSLGMQNGMNFWPRGKFLGGTSGINAMIYARGNRHDYDTWARLGNPTWDWDSVLEYFRKSEDNHVVSIASDRKNHGVGGPLKVDSYHADAEMKTILENCVREIGQKVVNDINGDENIGFVSMQGTIHNGRRFSAAKAFLAPAKDRANLKIIKNAHVTNIEFNQEKSVSGVNFVVGEKKLKAFARKEVVLSAGALNSPLILMNSGIGPENHLQEMNIEVINNLKVGYNLQDHVIVPFVLAFHKSSPKFNSHMDIVNSIYQYLTTNRGDFSHIGATDFTGFVSTVNHSKYPDIQYHNFAVAQNEAQLLLILNRFGYNDEIIAQFAEANKQAEIVIIAIALLNPKSKGTVELRSNNPLDAPKIYHNYFTERDDIETMVRGIRLIQKITTTKTFREHEGEHVRIYLPECDKTHEFDSTSYWECYSRYMSSTLYHPTGTVKMGPISDDSAVVDSRLKVHGVANLRVADASIMPNIISGNTNAPTIMIGEKLSDFIKQDWSDRHVEL